MCRVLIVIIFTVKLVQSNVLLFPTPNSQSRVIFSYGVPIDNLDYETVVFGQAAKFLFSLPASVKDLGLLFHGSLFRKLQSGNNDYEKNTLTINDTAIDLLRKNSSTWEEHRVGDETAALKRNNEINSFGLGYRWAVYKALEVFAERIGISGRTCLLKSICEMARTPFHFHNGLYGEVLHILLTPSSSVDRISFHSDNEYLNAEMLGKSGAPCERIFKHCPKSFLDQISEVYDRTHAIFNKILK